MNSHIDGLSAKGCARDDVWTLQAKWKPWKFAAYAKNRSHQITPTHLFSSEIWITLNRNIIRNHIMDLGSK